MLIFLGCIQLLLGWLLLTNRDLSGTIVLTANRTFLYFSISAVVFWLVWGGYSVDAWRYLARFDFNPLLFHEEQLFWITGYFLNKLVPDPWPIKILSAFSVIILSIAYFQHLKDNEERELVIAYILLLLTPGFFLLTGNTVRQGLSGSIEILGAVFFLQRKYWLWVLLATIGFLVHQFGILVVVALGIVKLFKKYLIYAWIASFLVSPLASYTLQLFGYDLEEILRYGSYSEGFFHWEKVLVSCAISAFLLASLKFQPTQKIDFRHVYLALVILSNSVAIYEVPFERIFLFSDLVAPLALAHIISRSTWIQAHYMTPVLLVSFGAVFLWTNPSIIKALGYI